MADLLIKGARLWPRVVGRRRGYRVMDKVVSPLLGRSMRWVSHGHIEVLYDFSSYLERIMAYELQGEEGHAFTRRLLKPGDTFVDAGTFAGMYSATAADIVGPTGTVWSIEANPAMVARLQKAIARNTGRVGHWEVIDKALSDREGDTIDFHLSREESWSSAMPLGEKEKPGEVVRVGTVTLDKLSERFGKVHLLKMDIEGSEGRALLGGTGWLGSPNAPDHIILECNDPALRRFGSSANEVISILKDNGYTPHRMHWINATTPGKTPLGEASLGDGVHDLLFSR